VLTPARTAATAAAKTADLAALKTEFDGVQANALPAEPPPDLPKTLLRRSAHLRHGGGNCGLGRWRHGSAIWPANMSSRSQLLRPRHSKRKDTALGEAVAGEKRRALALLESSGGGAKASQHHRER
jgi:hypothetical protein